ncbi:lipoprotein-anchoring transpeptidase ErfK/SrfK [Halopolyspora algeriensis]|uniref:Lipoprotein-anchoring transpeptidase ErfK/SrfK n=1 Tax=Halopolyspora algeriensis TaxID=1500506 RepID=A0A368VY50_9ACTN|nr:Ig-like domain-containing protein [Halopolyspora algeriensis]RCW46917.1 lipoprotein-anchoring transpeptidase ErfK/SrfK [Halopolyspora algeriensis]TQM48008.1 lipoprotein-anchoring transpeptidase ErfK/SrfK [Halopolyspora algeriensis]
MRSVRILLTGVLAVMLLVSGCGVGGRTTSPDSQEADPPPPQVRLEPADGATDVNPTAPVEVSVARGHFEEVVLTNESGEKVKGELTEDGTTWRTSEDLGYGKTYTWSGSAVGAGDTTVPVRGSFTTVQPKEVVRATITPVDDVTRGIAIPISIKFDAPVENKAAVQRALEVETSEPVTGSWAWLHDKQVDWRPKEYWPAHTEVSVRANLYGVNYGDGEYGKADLTTEFTIGRAQIVKADVDSHRIVVMRNGEQFASYPASYGRPGNPELHTHNGTYIVMAKHPVEIMDNPEYGYTDVKKKWAVRISNHGEFIHENEENRANIGRRNTSHGCINLTNADAKEYFHSALIGDPVEVTGSSTDMPPRYAVYDWMLSWQQWKSMSAL